MVLQQLWQTGFHEARILASMVDDPKQVTPPQMEQWVPIFPLMVEQANDGRNFVRKAVNWALCGIGKRNANLRRAAIATARKIAELGSPTAKWIAADALRELQTGA